MKTKIIAVILVLAILIVIVFMWKFRLFPHMLILTGPNNHNTSTTAKQSYTSTFAKANQNKEPPASGNMVVAHGAGQAAPTPTADSHPPEQLRNVNDHVGTISRGANGWSVYTNLEYNLRFRYPEGWYVGDTRLGEGTFQLYSYDNQKAESEGFPPSDSTNKIEVGIDSDATYINTEYQEKSRVTEKLNIAGQAAIREDIEVEYVGKIRVYFIRLPNDEQEYLGLVIYGDPSNFYVLDEIVQSLEWLPSRTPFSF